MSKNYERSLRKWNRDIWDELCTYYNKKTLKIQNSARRRGLEDWESLRCTKSEAWFKVAFNGCGFCDEFKECSKCPLFKLHCGGILSDIIEEEKTFGKLYLAWKDHNHEEFKMGKRVFVRSLPHYKRYFKEGVE